MRVPLPGLLLILLVVPPVLAQQNSQHTVPNSPKGFDKQYKNAFNALDCDPLNHVDVTGYIVDLDPLNCAEAYFYNAVANYKLNKIGDAEKSGLKAEHDLVTLTRFPQLHLLLGEIFARKNDYASAISEVQTYLELAPHAKNAARVREQLARLKKLNGLVSTSEKPNH
jgi:tetratricopeptide (TPR) repeat protein